MILFLGFLATVNFHIQLKWLSFLWHYEGKKDTNFELVKLLQEIMSNPMEQTSKVFETLSVQEQQFDDVNVRTNEADDLRFYKDVHGNLFINRVDNDVEDLLCIITADQMKELLKAFNT